jgi:multidrug resistance efflux pump
MTEPDAAELDAARTRITVNAAAAKLQRAKAQLKRLEIERAEPKRKPTRVRASRSGAILRLVPVQGTPGCLDRRAAANPDWI